MKTVRLLLLVLLALVLPFRGALANVAHCAGGASEFEHSVPLVHDHGADHAQQVVAHHEVHDHAGAQGDGGKASASASVDKCKFCTASCSATPCMSAAPTVATPAVVADAAFPPVLAPPPSHPSDGQERPPRSI